MSKKLFISYRREDSKYQARQIYAAFSRALPADTVFMDVDSIPPGADFVEILEGWVQQCDILLALIGPEWINSLDPRTGLRRLDNPDDFVRVEVRGALARKIPVVPVLLDATEMPVAAQLPEDIRALPRRNAEFVNFRTFDTDVDRLIAKLRINENFPEERRVSADRTAKAQDTKVSSEQIRDRQNGYRRWLIPMAAGLALILLTFSITRTLTVAPGDVAERLGTIELRLKEAIEALAKSEKARLEATARADGSAVELMKMKETLATSEIARQNAEAKTAAAAAGQANAEDARRVAEARVKQLAAAVKTPAQTDFINFRRWPTGSLIDSMSSNVRWAFGDPKACQLIHEIYTLEVSADALAWRHKGSVTVESVVSTNDDEIHTKTVTSSSAGTGQTWAYFRSGETVQMQAGDGKGKSTVLYRCQ